MKSEVRRRSQVVNVRLTPQEKADYTAFAVKLGKPLPEVMRLAMTTVLIHEAQMEVLNSA